jgi:hypothetical protein
MTRWRPGHICSDDYLVAVTYPIFATRDALTIDDAGSGPQLRHCLDNQRKASGQVVSGAAVELYALAHLSGDNAEAVLLDLVQPPRVSHCVLKESRN